MFVEDAFYPEVDNLIETTEIIPPPSDHILSGPSIREQNEGLSCSNKTAANSVIKLNETKKLNTISTATLPVIHEIQYDTNEEHDLLNVSRSTGTPLNSSDGGGGVDNGNLSSNDSDNTKISCARIPT